MSGWVTAHSSRVFGRADGRGALRIEMGQFSGPDGMRGSHAQLEQGQVAGRFNWSGTWRARTDWTSEMELANTTSSYGEI